MAEPPALRAEGAVAEPAVSASVTDDSLTFSVTCATPGARIFHSFDGAPQTPYAGPVVVDVAGRDLASEPVTFYVTAVLEGYTDAGVVTVKYPGLAPAFTSVYSAMAGEALSFAAADGVGAADWKAWTDALSFVTVKSPGAGGYARVDAGKYKASASPRTISFDASLLSDPGSYSFIFHASGYADKSASLTIKKAAPEVSARTPATIGRRVVFEFDDVGFEDGTSLYVTPPDGESSVISSNMLDRSRGGRVILKAAYFAGASCPVREPGEYVFSLVNGRFEPGTVDVKLKLEKGEPVPVFDDAAPSRWYFDAVDYVMSEGLFDAKAEGAFGPDDPMTRAMLAVALYRLEGSPASASGPKGGPGFVDVPAGSPSYDAVAWAFESGVTDGVGDGVFAPDDGITREQFATMIYRYAAFKNLDAGGKGDLSAFTDEGRVSAWARDALEWATGAGLVNGMGDGTLAPGGGTTRAQAATILMNWDS
jgi:hypothetical protein